MLISWLAQTEELLDRLDEMRRKIGVRRWRNMKHARSFKVRRKGKGNMVSRARKLHQAIRRGPVHNRHR